MFAKLVSSGPESAMRNILGLDCVESGSIPKRFCIEWGHYPGRAP